jgi:uncharacterized protein
MASTVLLASKVVVLEEDPQIPAAQALPSAIALIEGIMERGPINDPQLCTSFSEWNRVFGGFTTTADATLAAHAFFNAGGSYCYGNRIVHYTDLTNRTAHTAVKGTVNLQNTGSLATPAVVGPGTDAAPFRLDPAATLDLDLGLGAVTATFDATAASLIDGATYPVGPLVAQTMGFTIAGANGGAEQTVTAVGGETSAADIAAMLNAQLVGVRAVVDTGHVVLTTDILGTDASLQVTTEGTLNALLVFPTTEQVGGGDVGNIHEVTAAEAQTIIEADVAGVVVSFDSTDHMIISTVATGAGASLQVLGSGSIDFGLDGLAHVGAAAAPANTLRVDGKTPGAYTAAVKVIVAAATSGTASEFNLSVQKSGVIVETFPNVTMDDTLTNYVETVVNHVSSGSNLIAVTDLDVAGSPTVQRPANITSAFLASGDDGLAALADADYIGNSAGKTGLYAFDTVTDGTILILPGVSSAAVQLAMLGYSTTVKNGGLFCVLDPPAGQTAQQMVTFVTSNNLLEAATGEFGAMYWPRVLVSNPQPSVFGTDSTITVAPSGLIAGLYAKNDQKNGGVYQSPAGVGGGWGAIPGVVGFETDPLGASTHQVIDEAIRDLVYPKRINPITKLPGTAIHVDGGRTLRSGGSFPNVGERRGVIAIEAVLKALLVTFKHRYNNATVRDAVRRTITQYLVGEMNKGAFRSTDPALAFFVDVSDQLNPPANELAGILTARVGLATNKPAEYIVLTVTQDTRALDA